MRPRNLIVLIGLLVFLNTLYGCAGFKKEPVVKTYFQLDGNGPVPSQDNIDKGRALLVKEFFINPAFDSHSFVYRVGTSEYITDYYNEFLNYPAGLITERITETLYGSNYFKPAHTRMKPDIAYRLSGRINRLYGDFQDTHAPKAVIEIRMTLEKKIDTAFQTVSSKTYLAEEPILSRRPAQLVSGWNAGLTKIVARFISDFHPPAD